MLVTTPCRAPDGGPGRGDRYWSPRPAELLTAGGGGGGQMLVTTPCRAPDGGRRGGGDRYWSPRPAELLTAGGGGTDAGHHALQSS